MTELRVVLDTNILLVSIAKKSPYRLIFDAIISGQIRLIISNEILSEYTEIIERRANSVVAQNIAELLVQLPNVEKIEPSYKWGLITNDPDDNKFVDAAISGRVRYIVSNDKDYNILKEIKFPKVEVILIDQFLNEISQA